MHHRLRNSAIGLAAVIGVGLGGYGIAAAGNGSSTDDDGAGEADDHDTPLTGTELERATAAALDHMGGGEVIETETGDDGAAFGVEIRMPDGSEYEVNLDATFAVIDAHPDD